MKFKAEHTLFAAVSGMAMVVALAVINWQVEIPDVYQGCVEACGIGNVHSLNVSSCKCEEPEDGVTFLQECIRTCGVGNVRRVNRNIDVCECKRDR
jgi:hypothetical protein